MQLIDTRDADHLLATRAVEYVDPTQIDVIQSGF
jgi:hypothetical protein